MSKRSFRSTAGATPSYPTLRRFLAQRGRAVVAGLGLLAAGSLGACDTWNTAGVARLPPAPHDARIEAGNDGKVDGGPAQDSLPAADQDPIRADQQPPNHQPARR